MLLIRKGCEPKSLTSYKCQKYAYYGGLTEKIKDDIRSSLLSEQGNLCAYCMKRIVPQQMKIEHWMPQNKLDDSEALDYSNMLGCCLGCLNGYAGKEYETCDTHKGKNRINIDPRNPLHIDLIKYKSSDGTIYSDDAVFNRDINETLNLNNEFHMLKQNRKAVLTVFEQCLTEANRNGKFNKQLLRKLLLFYTEKNSKGNIPEYAGIILWKLKKMRGYPFV